MIGSNDINPDQSSPLVLAFSSTMNFVNYQKTRSSSQSSMNRSWTGEIVAQGRTTEGSSFALPSTVRSHETEPRILVTKTSTSTNMNTCTITSSKNGKNENTIENTATPTTTTNSRKNKSNVPRHVGLICDGNGRWASQRSLPRALGHMEGARRIVDLIQSLTEERKQKRQEKQEENNEHDSSSLVDCITLYWFSTENWNRSPAEINKIFEAAEFYINAFLNNTVVLEEARIRVLGDLDDPRLPKSLRTAMRKLEEKTSGGNDHKGSKNDNNSDSDNDSDNESDTHQSPRTPPFRRLDVCFAINYGGRQDIVSACQHIGQQVRDGIIVDPSSITEDLFSRSMSTSSSLQLECPDPDLIIRTGGEHRLSNFMTCNSAYSEIHVTDMLWPDFLKHTGWKRSLEWYKHRKRNFGGREQDDEEHKKERSEMTKIEKKRKGKKKERKDRSM